MMEVIELKNKISMGLNPKSPYNFDANFHKPSHFPSSDNIWKKNKYWITMIWKEQILGLKFENKGTIDKSLIKINIYSKIKLSKDFIDDLIQEIHWRFNFCSDISEFCLKYKTDKVLGPLIKKWKGMKPIAANSLYETLIIYIVLQNATVRRSVQMLENLFNKFGNRVKFDGKILSTFWEPKKMAKSSEHELRDLKLGYRAKFFMKLTEQFVDKKINEFELRKMNKEEIKKEILKLYGIGPASVEYLLFEDFYFLDSLETIPPWEQKIISRLIFNKQIVPTKRILNFFKKFNGWEKLAFHYIWEDIFWRRKHEHIEWLEKEIRL
jgi:3-methyladenine DNA glycosylase/8-oxoguanine DNA glycosylase